MQDLELYIEIGKNIRRRRREQMLTQEALSNSVESSSQYISRIERGQVGPSLEFLYKLAVALDCSVYSLLPASYPENDKFLSEEVTFRTGNCSKWKKQFLADYISWFLEQPDPGENIKRNR